MLIQMLKQQLAPMKTAMVQDPDGLQDKHFWAGKRRQMIVEWQ